MEHWRSKKTRKRRGGAATTRQATIGTRKIVKTPRNGTMKIGSTIGKVTRKIGTRKVLAALKARGAELTLDALKTKMEEDNPLPACDIMVQTQVDTDIIENFNRVYDASPNDCVINALELFGLDQRCAVMMRISHAGTLGFTIDQITKIFILILGTNIEFKEYPDYAKWATTINDGLDPGSAVFAAYKPKADGLGHVFVIMKNQEGRAEYLDPQEKTIRCDLSKDAKCWNELKGTDKEERTFFILHQSNHRLTRQQRTLFQFSA